MKTRTAREWRVMGGDRALLCCKKSRTKDGTSLRTRHEPSPELADLTHRPYSNIVVVVILHTLYNRKNEALNCRDIGSGTYVRNR